MDYTREKNVKTKTLYVMCGLPGSGKTHAAKRVVDRFTRHVSRDQIRLSLLEDGQEYFSQEKKVFSEYVAQIQLLLDEDCSVVADATHITKGSRAKLLNALKLEGVRVIAVDMFNVPYEICSKRNEKRVGRERVPREAMETMNRYGTCPSPSEGFDVILKMEYKGERE